MIFFTLICSFGSRLLVELVDDTETSLDFSNTLSCLVSVLSVCVCEVSRVNVCEVIGAMVKVLLLLLDILWRSEVSGRGNDRAAILEASLRSSRSLHTTGCTESITEYLMRTPLLTKSHSCKWQPDLHVCVLYVSCMNSHNTDTRQPTGPVEPVLKAGHLVSYSSLRMYACSIAVCLVCIAGVSFLISFYCFLASVLYKCFPCTLRDLQIQ